MPPALPEPGEVEEDEAGGHSDFITCKRENDAQFVVGEAGHFVIPISVLD